MQKIDYANNGGPAPDGDAERIETGAVQFGNDWPGLFIRGDEAMAMAQSISVVCDRCDRCAPLMGTGEYADLALALIDLQNYADLIRSDVIQ